MPMHEWEARVRHLEEVVNRIGDMLARAMDQIGQVDQNQRMQRPQTGAGNEGGARIAKNGASPIAAMSGTTMTSGTVTLYTVGDSGALTAGQTVTAYNLATGATGAVAANAWLQLKTVNGKRVIDWEQCS